jgi:hypothetical protein
MWLTITAGEREPTMPVIQFQHLPGQDDLPLPDYATAGAAVFDLRAAIPAGEDHDLLRRKRQGHRNPWKEGQP